MQKQLIMTKNIFIFFTFLIFKSVLGQTSETVKHIFLDLPLDKPRADIHKTIKADKRFKSTDKDTSYFNSFMYTYIGLTNDKGIIKSKPDSIEIELTYGVGSSHINGKKMKSYSSTYLKLRYFYSSLDSVEKEYQNILSVLRPILKDTSYTRIDTIFSDSPVRSQFKATGMTFKNKKTTYSVEVLNASIIENKYGLYLEYKKDEK